MLRINGIHIKGIGPIRDLNLNFDQHFNVICGQNGVGKTTILDCISQSFTVNKMTVKKHAKFEKGEWDFDLIINGENQSRKFVIDMFTPDEKAHKSQGLYNNSEEVIVFKTHRDIPHKKLPSITTDPKLDVHGLSEKALVGTVSSDLKNWFVNRHLWSKHDNHLDENQLENISLAKSCFSLLNPNIEFSRVDPASNDILLKTEDGEIYFEYLSSGYKSCLAVLIGLIKEIEFRATKQTKKAVDFSGIVLIDEVDLHLHPEWQAKIYFSLKKILPNAQIFTTTHSPHLIQVAESSEIIPLIKSDDLSIKKNEIVNKDFGCQGWSVEEILRDVMGMQETRTTKFNELISEFNLSIDEEEFPKARIAYEALSKMLHPDSSLKKVLSIQLVGTNEYD
jgi:predicted ATP-binding protein involved in virulence